MVTRVLSKSSSSSVIEVKEECKVVLKLSRFDSASLKALDIPLNRSKNSIKEDCKKATPSLYVSVSIVSPTSNW